MARVEVMRDVPNGEVPQLIADCKAEGALSVSAVDQGGGKSTVTSTWPDQPISAAAKSAVASGATIQHVAPTDVDTVTMQALAQRLGCDVAAVEAVAAVESSGTYFWNINGQKKPPVRLEAHWFGKLTNYKWNNDHQTISCKDWTPSLAATTQVGAYQQFQEASDLDEAAAMQACSWGAFQIMGFNWRDMKYANVQELVNAMQTISGQTDAFIRFVELNPARVTALKQHDWATFAKLYNGDGNIAQYAGKMAAAWLSHSTNVA